MTKHISNDYLEIAEDIRHTPKYKKIYKKRKETIERVFADAKEKYGMRYTLFRGLAQVTNWVRLKFAAMNLKKYAIHKWNKEGGGGFNAVFTLFHMFFFQNKLIAYVNQKTTKPLFSEPIPVPKTAVFLQAEAY